MTATTTVRIPLTQQQTALIDAADVKRVRPYFWTATIDAESGRWYARTSMPGADGELHVVLLHRFILDEAPGTGVQFIDGDTLNCTRANMIGGVRNRHAIGRGSSIYKGVSFVAKKKTNPWRAEVRFGGEKYYIGGFETEIEAADAFDAKWIELGGDPRLTNRAIMAALAKQGRPPRAAKNPPKTIARAASRNASGYRGVTLFNGRWYRATIWLNNKTKLIGYWEEAIDAARAFDREVFLRDGAKARLNFPDDDPMAWVAPERLMRVPRAKKSEAVAA